MGYSTTLYFVDLEALALVIGSKDKGLVERIRKREAEALVGPKRRQVRVQVEEELSVVLDGRPSSLSEAAEAFAALGEGNLLLFLGRSEEAVRLGMAELQKISDANGGKVAKVYFYPRNATEAEFWADPDAVPVKRGGSPVAKAAAALIDGNHNGRIKASDYGCALERLCQELGERSELDDAVADIESLRLDSPLAEPRKFPGVPLMRDFPIMSYLKAGEVEAEATRLEGIDLSFPEDVEVEEGRRALAAAITRARELKLGVLTFYY